jgi:hypothetical protein
MKTKAPNCPIHDVPMICFCPVCRGEKTSKSKAAAARRNGALGGRPRIHPKLEEQPAGKRS